MALVPRRMAVDFIKDEDGKLWLLQVLSLLALLVQRYLSLLALLVQKYKYRMAVDFIKEQDGTL